jgi:hypothetical protein
MISGFHLASANSFTTLEKIFQRHRGLCASLKQPLAWLGDGEGTMAAMRLSIQN